jgi:HlyD family secretion protein
MVRMTLPVRIRWLAVTALLLLGLVAAVVMRLQAPSLPALALQSAPLQRSLQFSARASSRARVELGATVTGRVQQVKVQAGDAVKAGDVLLTLEADDAQANLAQALAAEQQAGARLEGLRQSGRSVAQAGTSQAQANLAAALAEQGRTQALVAQGFLSPARLDESRRALAVARAQADAATAQQAALGEASTQPAGTEVQQAQAQRAAATAAVASARARLAQTVIQAPADARVLERQAEPGQIVQPGRVLLSLALQTPLELVAQVDERHLAQLQPGQTAHAVADAFSGQRLAATVLRIAPVVDAQRGAVEVRLRLNEAPPPFVREDMGFSVEVLTGQRNSALSLPLAALVQGADGQAQAWVVQDGRARLRPVQTGMRTLQAVEITAGLQPGDTVLLAPLNGAGLHEGQRVRADTAAGQAWLQRAGKADDAGSAMLNAFGR